MAPATTADGADQRSLHLTQFAIAVGAIALLGLGVRLAFTLTLGDDIRLRADPLTYHYLAVNLAHGLGYVRPPQQNPVAVHHAAATAEFPPLFPGLLALFTVLGAVSVTTQKLLMCGVGTGTVVLVGLAGRRLVNPGVGLLAALLAAVHPLIFQPDGVLMSESLYMFLVSGALLAALLALAKPQDWWRWAILGALLGLASLTRAEGLLLLLVLAVPLALYRGGPMARDRARAVLVVVAATVIIVLPWTVRNAVRFDQFVPVSNNAGTVALGANCQTTYHGRQLGSWDFNCIKFTAAIEGSVDVIAPGKRDEAQVYNHWRTEGYQFARQHSSALPKVVAARVLRTWGMWNPSTEIGFDVGEGRNRTLQTVGYWLGLSLLPFAAIGAVSVWRRRRPLWIVLAPVVVATIVSVVGFGSTRTRAVAEPGLAILAAAGLLVVAATIRSMRGRTSGGAPAGTPEVETAASGR